MVAQKLDAKLRDHLQSRNNLFSDALSGQGWSGLSRPALVLVDRGAVDLPVCSSTAAFINRRSMTCWLCVQMSSPLGPRPANRLKRRRYDIDVNEPFFGENARLDFGIGGEHRERPRSLQAQGG